MGRFDQARANLRRAYANSRETVRAAREKAAEEATAAEDAPEEPVVGDDPPPPSPIEETVPRGLRVAAAWSWRLIVVAVAVLPLLWLADRYIILVAPLMIALLLTGLLAPALRWLRVLRLPRTLATLVVLVSGLALVGGFLTLVINQLIEGSEKLRQSAEDGILRIEEWLRGPPLEMSDADLEGAVQQGQDWIESNTEQLTDVGLSAVTGTVQFLTGLVLVLVAAFFFLRDGGRIWHFLVGILPGGARAPVAYAGEGAWRSLSGYVRATVLVAFIDAVGIGLGLWILQVPLAVPLAALVFLGAFVPIVGAFVSGAVAVLVALVDSPTPDGGLLEGGGPIKALMVLGLIILVQQIEGNVLQPVIMSRAVKIHPFAVIIAVTFGILVAGVIGALVAVPVVAVLNAVIRRLHAYGHRPPPDGSHPAGADPPDAGPSGTPASATTGGTIELGHNGPGPA